MDTFAALEIKPPFTISLAKQQEEVFVPGESESRKLSRHSFALRLLQYVRDEAPVRAGVSPSAEAEVTV